jgi:FkbM family methyltransferase
MSANWNDRRFSVQQVLLACVLVGAIVAVASAWVARSRAIAEANAAWHPEAQALRDKYGPHRNSYHTEEWIIRDFFQDRKDGVFVDVGANHYQITSNTYYLEKQLDWSGIAIEPLREFEADYVKHRPRTRFRPFFVSDVSNEKAKMYVLSQSTLISSADKSFTERAGRGAKEIEVPTITLNDLLDAERVQRIDFLSMDIELSEPKALAGFDIARFRPQLVCIEMHPEVRQQILDYFARHGYVIVGKYVLSDQHNLYFTPLS